MYKAASRFRQAYGWKLNQKRIVAGPKAGRTHSVAKAPEFMRRVYVIRFTSILGDDEEFIKIGVSGIDLLARFQRDWRKFRLEVLAESEWLPANDAFTMEGAFHDSFRDFSIYPKVPLWSGNTECYSLDGSQIDALVKVVLAARPTVVAESDPIGGGVVPRRDGGFYRLPTGKGEKRALQKARKRWL